MFDLYENVVDLAASKKTGGGDLPFGKETTTVKEVLAEKTVTLQSMDGFYNGVVATSGFDSVTEGKAIKVVFDGVSYDCIANHYEVTPPGTSMTFVGVSLGNLSLAIAGSEDTGEPFAMAIVDGRCTMAAKEGAEHTVAIYEEVTTVTKISGKYVEGMGWSEGGGENIFNGAEPAYSSSGDRFCLGSPRININKSYDITIRGDVYKNVAPAKVIMYYPMVCWGNDSAYDIAADAEYPFQITAVWLDGEDNDGNPIWDSNGDFVGKPGNFDSWMYPEIRVSREKYPDLKPEDVRITECEVIHPIDPKFMPNMLVTINVVFGDDGMVSSASMKGASFAEILSALKAGPYVCVYFKNNLDSTICVGEINSFNDESVWVYDRGSSNYFAILPDNTVTLD
jgi:hypothetical protein